MILQIILLIVGFILLIKGADFFVDGSAAIAGKLKIPGFIVGMTVVAMGTSAPECAVSISASIKGINGMAISNVIGSNIFNLLVVCGMCALFSPLVIKKDTLKKEFPFSIYMAALIGLLGAYGMVVGHIDGVVLLVFFVFFLISTVRSAKKTMAEGGELEGEEIKDMSILKCVVCIIGGLAGIVLGGQFVVNSAQAIALQFGMSETLVGLTICSIGTSLPELVTSFVAARKGQAGMALGNVIGSNIFNILLVGGLASAISPIAMTMNNLIDIVILVMVSVYVMIVSYRKQQVGRIGGISMLAIYAAYMIYICIR